MLCLRSGGYWNNGSTAGVWAANLNNYRSNSNVNSGFRADCGSVLISRRGTVESQGGIILRHAKSCAASFLVGQPTTRRRQLS